MSAHAHHEKKTKLPDGFFHAGNAIYNRAHVVRVVLPTEGDPKQPFTIECANGAHVQLAGDDATAALEAFGAS